jgi:hypothetical protein
MPAKLVLSGHPAKFCISVARNAPDLLHGIVAFQCLVEHPVLSFDTV